MKHWRIVLLVGIAAALGGLAGYTLGWGRCLSWCRLSASSTAWALVARAGKANAGVEREARVGITNDWEALLAIWRVMDGTTSALRDEEARLLSFADGGHSEFAPFEANNVLIRSQILTAMSVALTLNDLEFADYLKSYRSVVAGLASYNGTNRHVLEFRKGPPGPSAGATNASIPDGGDSVRLDPRQIDAREKLVAYLSSGRHVSALDEKMMAVYGPAMIAMANGTPSRESFWSWLSNIRARF